MDRKLVVQLNGSARMVFEQIRLMAELLGHLTIGDYILMREEVFKGER